MYGVTDAIVGTFDLMRKVGMISKSDAETTPITTHTVNLNGRRSQFRCQRACAKMSILWPIAATLFSRDPGIGGST